MCILYESFIGLNYICLALTTQNQRASDEVNIWMQFC